MPLEIRALRADEREEWQVLWKGYQEFYEANLDDVTDSLWQRLMADDENSPVCLVAESDGKLLGLVQYLFHDTTWSPKERIYLHDLYTSPESRGQGVGRALIEAVYDAAKVRGCEQVYWMTQEFNANGRALYDKVATLTPFIKYAKNI